MSSQRTGLRFATAARLAALLGLALLTACETAPVTGRKQLILLSDSQATQMGVDAYQTY